MVTRKFQAIILLITLLSIILFVSIIHPRAQFIREKMFFSRNNSFSTSESKFMSMFTKFPWDILSQAIATKELETIHFCVEKLIQEFTPYVIMEPLVPINSTCRPPLLRHRLEINCTTGLDSSVRKVGMLIQFGFDVDMLEVHLNELNDVVDKFFIVESTHTHNRFFKKPLIWEAVKHQSRFAKFASKIVHFVVDDAPAIGEVKSSLNDTNANFVSENLQEKLRWEKFLEWNNVTNFFSPDDLLGFGDSDEIASREAVNYLKHCALKSDPIDVGIWFPVGTIYSTMKSNFPVKGYPFTLGDPSFWTLRSAMSLKTIPRFNLQFPTRNRGMSDDFVLGGMHMTHYGYFPFLVIKRVAASESGYEFLQEFPEFTRTMNSEKLQTYFSSNMNKMFEAISLESLGKSETEKFVVLPWFYNCNRDRYPAWEEKPDSRLI